MGCTSSIEETVQVRRILLRWPALEVGRVVKGGKTGKKRAMQPRPHESCRWCWRFWTLVDESMTDGTEPSIVDDPIPAESGWPIIASIPPAPGSPDLPRDCALYEESHTALRQSPWPTFARLAPCASRPLPAIAPAVSDKGARDPTALTNSSYPMGGKIRT